MQQVKANKNPVVVSLSSLIFRLGCVADIFPEMMKEGKHN